VRSHLSEQGEDDVAEVHPPTRGRLHQLDLFRFVAAFAVLAFHFTFMQPANTSTVGVRYPDALTAVTRFGYLGVDLFFVISGFVVFMSVWGRQPGDFVASRVARLFPAYWIGVTVAAAATLWLNPFGHGVPLHQYLVNLTMVQSWLHVRSLDAVYWTLGYELTFYAVLLVVALTGMTRRKAAVLMWTWLALDVLVRIVPLPGASWTVVEPLLMPTHSHYFIAGMAMFLWFRDGRSAHLAALICACTGKAVYEGWHRAGTEAGLSGHAVPPGVAVALVVGIILLMWAVADGRLTSLARPRYAVLGALTYPLYLLHNRVGASLINAIQPVVGNRWVVLAIATGTALSLAWLVHRFVERPLQPRLRAAVGRALTAPGRRRPIQARASRRPERTTA
jgi:peptidoglycan/LPS O-acetylase OafA/YrhL